MKKIVPWSYDANKTFLYRMLKDHNVEFLPILEDWVYQCVFVPGPPNFDRMGKFLFDHSDAEKVIGRQKAIGIYTGRLAPWAREIYKSYQYDLLLDYKSGNSEAPSYDCTRTVWYNMLLKHDDFMPIWNNWVMHCYPPEYPDDAEWQALKNFIRTHTNADEAFTQHQLDVYYLQIYKDMAYPINDLYVFDMEVTFR